MTNCEFNIQLKIKGKSIIVYFESDKDKLLFLEKAEHTARRLKEAADNFIKILDQERADMERT